MSKILDWNAMTRDERIAVITEGVAKGLSAGRIASKFVGASRNAVISYCYRHKIGTARPKPAKPAKTAATAQRVPPKAFTPAITKTESPQPIPSARAISKPAPDLVDLGPIAKSQAFQPIDGAKPIRLEDLGAMQCHWPVNGFDGRDAIFCGVRTRTTYCASHSRLAYQPRG